MPISYCPHCHAGQEVPLKASSWTCTGCGEAFSPGATPSPTQRIVAPGASTPLVTARPAESLPSVLGPYEIRGVIGSGGMGIVYEGWDARLSRAVAVKTLKPELAREPAFCERFLREARAAAALSHPNVTQIYYIGEDQGRPFFAMEFLEGRSLDVIVREEGKLAPSRAIELIRQSGMGLRAAAARGVIHRDIKPSNLVLTRDGLLKVTDFGLAKIVVADSGLTLAGEVLGSPNYLAPEQASGAPADVRSDIYSLGATLYELITGRPPYEGPTPVSIILKHVREPLRSPRQFSPDLPVPLVTLTQRMLAKRPEDRPKDYDALMRELDRLLSPAATPLPPSRPLSSPSLPRPGSEGASGGSYSGLWILIPIVALGIVALWGFLKQSRAAADAAPQKPSMQATLSRSSEGEDAGANRDPDSAGRPETSGGSSFDTKVLSTIAEVAPQAGGAGLRHRTFDVAPRLERLREAGRANLQFVENNHEITLDGRLKVRGSVYNAGLAAAADIRVKITLSDASGQIVASSEIPLSPSFLGSQQAGTFEVLFPDPHRSINIKAELNWNS